MDDYVLESLTNLEMELERYLNQVRNGIRSLMQQAEAAIQEQQGQEASNEQP